MDRPAAPVQQARSFFGLAALALRPAASPARPFRALREDVRAGARGAGSSDFNGERLPSGTPGAAFGPFTPVRGHTTQ